MSKSKSTKSKNEEDSEELIEDVESEFEDWQYIMEEENLQEESEKKPNPKQSKCNSARFNQFKSDFTAVDEPKILFSNLPQFRHESGPKNMPEIVTPESIFELFFSPEFIDYLTEQANIYRLIYLKGIKNEAEVKRIQKYPVYSTDIYGYLACFILMGITRFSDIEDHWSSRPLLLSGISRIMAHRRFIYMTQIFHLMDSSKDDGTPLYKVKSLLPIIEKWRHYYSPGKNLTLDETIIPFTGKSKLVMFNMNKPEKYGIKCFTLCDSRNYYCIELRIYTGPEFSQKLKDRYKTTLNASISLEMTKNFWYKNHYLFVDNFYNSAELGKLLLDRNVYITGTINFTKPEMAWMDSIIGRDRDRYEYAYVASDYANVVRIRNCKHQKKTAFILTTVFSEVKIKNETGRDYPNALKEYNANKGGVDKMNAMLVSFRNMHKNRKWWKAVFAQIMDMTIINAYIIYKTFNNKITHKEYRLRLVEYYVTKYVKPSFMHRMNGIQINSNVKSKAKDIKLETQEETNDTAVLEDI